MRSGCMARGGRKRDATRHIRWKHCDCVETTAKTHKREAWATLWTREREGTVVVSSLVGSHKDLPGHDGAEDGERDEAPDDAEEPPEAVDALARNVHVHAPQTGDQVHGDEDGTERRQLGQDAVDLVVGVRHL